MQRGRKPHRIFMRIEKPLVPRMQTPELPLRALAYRLRGQERQRGIRAGRVRLGDDGQNSSILRPTTAFKSSSVGTLSDAK